MMRFLFFIILLAGHSAFAQNRGFVNDSSRVAATKLYVNAVNKHTILTRLYFTKSLKEIKNDTVNTIFNQLSITHAAYYNNSNVLQKISVFYPGMAYNGRSLAEYYFEHGKLVYVFENYINKTRMGSCGEIEFKNKLFFYNNKLIALQTKQRPDFDFYAGCYPLELSEQIILDELDVVLKRIEEYRNRMNSSSEIPHPLQ